MVKVIFVKKNGSLKNSSIKLDSLDNLYKKCLFSSNNHFDNRNIWSHDNNVFYSIFSKNKGKAGNENKYELPPPIDNELYFGTMVILKHSKKMYDIDNLLDLSLDEWRNVYEKLFGGFDDLDEEEDVSSDEYVNPENLTKEGYDKTDGFIVDDDDSISVDSDSDDLEEFVENDSDALEQDYDDDDEDDDDEDDDDDDEDDEDEDDDEDDDEEDEDDEDDDYCEDEDYLTEELYVDESDDESGDESN